MVDLSEVFLGVPPATDSKYIMCQVKEMEEEGAVALEGVSTVKSTMGRVLSAWDSYCDCYSSLQAWLEQASASHALAQSPEVQTETLH